MQVQSLGREDPPEYETTTHSSILAWRIPWTEELGVKKLPYGAELYNHKKMRKSSSPQGCRV